MNSLRSFIIEDNLLLYTLAFVLSTFLSIVLSPFFRYIAVRFDILDKPSSQVKTHTQATPYLGGCAIALAFVIALFILRNFSSYPSGTLRPIQGIFYGGFLVFLLGLIDDIIAGGLSYKEKFVVQFIAAAILPFFGIQIHFIQPNWLAWIFTMFWTVAVMNAFNIIDIMDGLAGTTALIAACAFGFIALPTEHIYVNFVATVLAGAVLGFLPHNFSRKHKMFMGDTGSLFIGYVLAALSMGTPYSTLHNAGVLAPILILGVPLYDTIFVMILRTQKGISPFLGSKDHFALRLEKLGFSRRQVVAISAFSAVALSICAWLTTQIWFWYAAGVYVVIFIFYILIGMGLSKIKID